MKKTILYAFLFLIVMIYASSVFAAQQPVIIFGITFNYLPFSYVDSKGNVYGFSVSFTQLLCKQLNSVCEYRPMVFDDLFTALQDNKIDAAAAAITITPARQQNFNFTVPVLPSTASFIGLKQANIAAPITATATTTANNINKKIVIGVQTGSLYPEYLSQTYPGVVIKEYARSDVLIASLAQNQIDFAMMDTPTAEYWVNQAYDNLRLVGDPIDLNLSIGIMLNKNNPQLLAQLNSAILTVTKSPEFADLLSTYFTYYKT